MRFTELELSEPLQKSVHSLGYENPTPIQVQAIPPAIRFQPVNDPLAAIQDPATIPGISQPAVPTRSRLAAWVSPRARTNAPSS